jgi:hypothetical protein
MLNRKSVGFKRRNVTPIARVPLAHDQNPFERKPKLKQARGALARAINARLIPPPPGYQGPKGEVT